MTSIQSQLDNVGRAAVNLALGRIFKMASRAEQPDDAAEYEKCRALIFSIVEAPAVASHSYARDFGKGAQGQW